MYEQSSHPSIFVLSLLPALVDRELNDGLKPYLREGSYYIKTFDLINKEYYSRKDDEIRPNLRKYTEIDYFQFDGVFPASRKYRKYIEMDYFRI